MSNLKGLIIGFENGQTLNSIPTDVLQGIIFLIYVFLCVNFMGFFSPLFSQEREQKQKLLAPAPVPTSQRSSEKYIYPKKEVRFILFLQSKAIVAMLYNLITETIKDANIWSLDSSEINK